MSNSKVRSTQKHEKFRLLGTASPDVKATLEKSFYCLRCLACCKHSYIEVSQSQENQTNLSFLSFKGFEFFSIDTKLFLVVKTPCKHLTNKGCKIYAERPQACRNYDGRNDPLLGKDCLWNMLTLEEGDGKEEDDGKE